MFTNLLRHHLLVVYLAYTFNLSIILESSLTADLRTKKGNITPTPTTMATTRKMQQIVLRNMLIYFLVYIHIERSMGFSSPLRTKHLEQQQLEATTAASTQQTTEKQFGKQTNTSKIIISNPFVVSCRCPGQRVQEEAGPALAEVPNFTEGTPQQPRDRR